jgi:transposase
VKKELLEECLGEGLSLEAIGKRVGKHESTVSYWLKKHGLVAAGSEKHSPSGKVDPDRLRALVEAGVSIQNMAKELGVGCSTVRYWLRKLELETDRSMRLRESERACRDGSKSVYLKCPTHGHTAFVVRVDGRFRCGRCRSEAVSKRRRSVKRTLVEEAGGKCILCGYRRCHRALEFHHLDPRTKEFDLGRTGVSRSLARCRAEASKCVLLCSNCHAEVEAGITAVPLNSLPGRKSGVAQLD